MQRVPSGLSKPISLRVYPSEIGSVWYVAIKLFGSEENCICAKYRTCSKKENCMAFTNLEAQKLIFKLDMKNIPRKTQLIYNATARSSLIQSKIQSAGEDEFSQFIPDTVPQFSMWAISEREQMH